MPENSNFEWYADVSDCNRVAGWIADRQRRLPAELSFVSEGRTLFRAVAGKVRLDVHRAGRGCQFCGIDIIFDSRIWDEIETLDAVLADGSIFTSVSKSAGSNDMDASVAETRMTGLRYPMRIKVYRLHADNTVADCESFYFAQFDGSQWIERLLLRESAVPSIAVVNDEYVTVVCPGTSQREDAAQHREIESLDNLTHTQLKADDNSDEENYAALSGELFQLSRGITICYGVRVVKP